MIALDLLDTDGSGVIYLGAVIQAAGQTPAQSPPPSILLLCIDPLDGRPLGTTPLPANTDADETFKQLVVPEEGGVLYLHRTEQGAELRR